MTRPYTRSASSIARQKERNAAMAALFRSGKTLQEIGNIYGGVSREYIRQCLEKTDVTAAEGGSAERARQARTSFEARRDAKTMKRCGCNWAQYVELRCLKVPRLFNHQRQNAYHRGIAWEFSLWQWWSFWQDSGRWPERGRGQGYVMCRIGDVGPYSVANVFIAPARENSSNNKNKKSGLPIGVGLRKRDGSFIAKRCLNNKMTYLGSYPSPELAHAAYLAAAPVQ